MNTVILKIGGSVLNSPIEKNPLIREIASLELTKLAIVHGGGGVINKIFQDLGHTPQFHEGVRMTSITEMPLVDMALAGKINTAMVRALCTAGKKAVGITGSDACLISAEPFSDDSCTGKAQQCNPSLLIDLWENGYLPLIAPVCNDANGKALNVNADEVADVIARSLKESTLVFITDVSGIFHNDKLLSDIAISEQDALIAHNIVNGGMQVKLQSACASIQAGVSSVYISSIQDPGDLTKILQGKKGTRIHE